MTDGQNWGWQPEQGYGRQYGQGQPWQAAQDGSGVLQAVTTE